jgi:plasmid stabilization system protein ParE
MTYQVEISSVAEAEADQAFLWMAQQISQEAAKQWYQGLLQAIESLAKMPKRCPLAPENSAFSLEIRQLLYGKGRGKYRVVFTIIENADSPTVRILHIRHVAKRRLNDGSLDENN